MAKQKIRIRLKAYDHKLLDLSAKKIVEAVKLTNAKVSGPVPLPTERTLYTVLTSPISLRMQESSLRNSFIRDLSKY